MDTICESIGCQYSNDKFSINLSLTHNIRGGRNGMLPQFTCAILLTPDTLQEIQISNDYKMM